MRHSTRFVAAAAVVAAAITMVVYASTPASHDVTVPTTDGGVVVVEWTGSVPPGAAGAGNRCVSGVGTDGHGINLTVPAGTYDSVNVVATFHIDWTGSGDLVLSVERAGTNVGNSDGGTPEENVSIANPTAASYQALACAFAATGATAIRGKLTLTATAKPSTAADADFDGVPDTADTCPGTPKRTPVDAAGCPYPAFAPGVPRFFYYSSPAGVADDSGEPSVGCSWKTEKTFTNTNVDESPNLIPNGGTETFFGGFTAYMSKITFDDCASPANMTWDKKSLLAASTPRAAGDPILFTDNTVGRTWVIQLEPGAGATIDYTDNDGSSFLPSTGPATAGNDFDHETLASGPYHAPLTGGVVPGIKYAVYYASQGVSEAVSWRSDDGGATFNAKIPMFTVKDCAGLHGHVKVAPDGTVYVPDKSCKVNGVPLLNGGNASAIVSEDNGLTWAIRPITQPAGAGLGSHDPSIGIATDGTVYLGYQSKDGHPRIAVSHNKGVSWSEPVDVGTSVLNGKPVLNTAFPAVVAGDPNRAAFVFFGTEIGGSNWNQDAFPGNWYLYIATTFDGGATWTTQNATPGDPIQRGGICSGAPCRNLLDFFDATIDKEGRIIVGGEDGCISDACIDGVVKDRAKKGFITRQTGGKRMFAAYDPVEPARPGAPRLAGGLNEAQDTANLSWTPPDNGASAVTAYNVYHRIGTSGPFALRGTVTTNEFSDKNYNKNVENFYHVTAVNAVGEGPYCLNFHPTLVIPPDPCKLPGIKFVEDATGDAQGGDDMDIEYVAQAELADYADNIILTYKVKKFTAGLPPASSFYLILFPNNSNRYIALDSTQGPAQFVYGTAVPDPAGQGFFTFNKQGNLDARSRYTADGTMTMVVPRSVLGNPAVGTIFSGIDIRARIGSSSANSRDTAGPGSFTVKGAAACALNNAPTGKLTATPDSGTAPLTVSFDGSGSHDEDSGDSIAQYEFQFGDGDGGFSGSASSISYIYETPGTYVATLRVTDSHGLQSATLAEKVITVTGPGGSTAPANNVLGGALSLLSTALLGAFGLRRRRNRR